MMLETLIQRADMPTVIHGEDVDITGICADSRAVKPGDAFVAVRGLSVDGHRFIPAALEGGAAALVVEEPWDGELGAVTQVVVPDSTEALGRLADAWYGHPTDAISLMAVTGTNGKTTVAWLLEQLLRGGGAEPGLLGTVETRYRDQRLEATHTTPPSLDLHGIAATMRDAGCDHVLMEASSHGLEQGRLAGARVAVAGFTNLSRDHLDYHGTMEAYSDAKEALFSRFAHKACFHVGDPVGRRFSERFEGPSMTVAIGDPSADLWIDELKLDLQGSRGVLHHRGERFPWETPLLGRHNVENALVALGMSLLGGMSMDAMLESLRGVAGAPGRLERVEGAVPVVVDYAHTPDALTNVLRALRSLVSGDLICVFGAGGDRDRGKRPAMAAAAGAIADRVIVTSDNPRTEDPAAIVEEVVGGLPEGARSEVRVDRREAIHLAVSTAGPDDLVLVAGKGHEPYQEIHGVKHPFDDCLVAREALETRDTGGAA